MYSDKTAEKGEYEQHIGFFWADDTSDSPQDFTINFKLSEEMEEDYPYIEDDMRVEQGIREQENWVADHIDILLEFGFVTCVFDHDEIDSVEELEENLDRLDFRAFYY